MFLTGCFIMRTSAPTYENGDETDIAKTSFALVVKDVNNSYMRTMFSGFEEACSELGIDAQMVGPDGNSDAGQSELIEQLISQKIDGIAVAANDSGELSTALKKAVSSGVSVVSLDSPVNPEDRSVHIQQASPEVIGRVLIQAGAEIIENKGEIAILSTTETMPNQSSWVSWMKRELEENPEKYKDIELVDISYGQDDEGDSAEKTKLLLARHPNLKLIIAPTVVGLRAAAKVITDGNSPVKVTGLGLPSEMEEYINSGVCPWMYLWSPSDVGYLSVYALYTLQTDTFTGVEGDIFTAGTLGERLVTKSEDGGTEIVLGKPLMISPSNVSMWKEIF
jgi:rhamnose transport system substrate-binding protein